MPLYPTGVSRIPLRKQVTGRASLGPPDVYPQDPNQKEDELNAVHVKQGFTQSHSSMVSEEYGSMISKSIANEPVASAKVLADLKSIIGASLAIKTSSFSFEFLGGYGTILFVIWF